MAFKKHIPNILTLFNLLLGSIAIIFAVKNHLIAASIFVVFGIIIDFFDGFSARLLKVQGELGKQLDSLADVVTSGLAPGIIMFQLLGSVKSDAFINLNPITLFSIKFESLSFVGLLITLAAAYRLAKFNIDIRQTNEFIGLPTPAAALVVISFPLILEYSSNNLVITLIENTWFLVVVTLFLCYLMNANIKLFSLKFKEISWKNNRIKYTFIGLAILALMMLKFVAIPVIVFLYILLSVIDNRIVKT